MRKCLRCEFPPCNCQKCIKLRLEGRPDRDATIARDSSLWKATFEDDNSMEKVSSTKNDTSNKFTLRGSAFHKLKIPKFEFTPSNLSSVLFDIVGIVAFFIMASTMFWITIVMYLWRFIIMIYQSGRKMQIISLVLLALLSLCITFHAIQGRYKHRKIQALQNSKSIEYVKQCSGKSCKNLYKNDSKQTTQTSTDDQLNSSQKDKLKSCGICNFFKFKKSKSSSTSLNNCQLKKSQTPSLCDLCYKEMISKKSISESILSEDEAREMFEKSKLYAIPTEMKFPPSSLVHLVDYLSDYFYGITGITVATLPPF